MNLKEINILFTHGKFQQALIEYESYMTNNPYMLKSLLLNDTLSRFRLHEQLLDYCKMMQDKVATEQIGSDDLTFIIPWCFDKDQLKIESYTWYRLDYVVNGVRLDKTNNFKIHLPNSDKDFITLKVNFEINKLQTLFFKYPVSDDLKKSYQGYQSIGSYKISYTLQKIDQNQLYSQFIFELARFFKMDINKVFAKSKLVNDLDAIFGEKSLAYYFASLLGEVDELGGLNSAYMEYLKQDLNDCANLYFYNTNQTAYTQFNHIKKTNLAETKSQLGEHIDFSIDGFKCFGSTRVFYGWIIDLKNNIESIKLIDESIGSVFEVNNNLLRFNRPDVVKAFNLDNYSKQNLNGFVVVVDLADKYNCSGEVIIKFTTKNGKNFIQHVHKEIIPTDNNTLNYLLGILPDQTITAERCEKFYKPIFNALTKIRPTIENVFDKTYGVTFKCKKPLLSIIIPLYGNTRFELTQIPAIAALKPSDWELILAVDDPNILSEVQANSERLALLYGIAVRVVSPNTNLGFSGINNFAVDLAQGDFLLFLNSDCFITQIQPFNLGLNWLQNEENGAVGFRLLFANKTIQHDGMSVSKWNNSEDFYLNDHPDLGTPVNLITDNNHTTMLTAACLMMRKDTFLAIDGFNRMYLRGDFEDSDLCLKLLSHGKKLGIVKNDGIYHLERQTIINQEAGLRQLITLVNSYCYSQRWKHMLYKELPELEVVQ